MKVLVVGSTGKYAWLVVPELKKRGATVRAFVREAKSEGAAAKTAQTKLRWAIVRCAKPANRCCGG